MNNQSTEPETPTFQDRLKEKNTELLELKSKYAKSTEVLNNNISSCNSSYSTALKDLQSTYTANEDYLAMIVNFQSQKIKEMSENQSSIVKSKEQFDIVLAENAAEIKRLVEENAKLSQQHSATNDTVSKLQTRNNAIQPELNKLQRKHNELLNLHRSKDQQIQNYSKSQSEMKNTIQQLRARTSALAQSNNDTSKRFNYAWTELLSDDQRFNLNRHFGIELPSPQVVDVTDEEKSEEKSEDSDTEEKSELREDNIAAVDDDENNE